MTDAADDTCAYPPFMRTSRRFSCLFTQLFTCKSECMKLPTCPLPSIHPLYACTARLLACYSQLYIPCRVLHPIHLFACVFASYPCHLALT